MVVRVPLRRRRAREYIVLGQSSTSNYMKTSPKSGFEMYLAIGSKHLLMLGPTKTRLESSIVKRFGPHFCQLQAASIGSTVRVFGRSLAWDGNTCAHAQTRAAYTTTTLLLTPATAGQAQVSLPASNTHITTPLLFWPKISM